MASRGECNQRRVLKVAALVYVPVLVITDVSDKPPASHQSATEGSHRTVMAKEMVRVTRPGGKVAAYVWDYAGGMEMLRHFWDVAIELNPKDSTLDQGQRFPLCQPEPLEALFRVAGLTSISVRAIEIPIVFRDFDDYWRPFPGKQGAAPSYLASLDGETRDRIRDALKARLVAAADGSIAMTARAWAVQGTV